MATVIEHGLFQVGDALKPPKFTSGLQGGCFLNSNNPHHAQRRCLWAVGAGDNCLAQCITGPFLEASGELYPTGKSPSKHQATIAQTSSTNYSLHGSERAEKCGDREPALSQCSSVLPRCSRLVYLSRYNLIVGWHPGSPAMTLFNSEMQFIASTLASSPVYSTLYNEQTGDLITGCVGNVFCWYVRQREHLTARDPLIHDVTLVREISTGRITALATDSVDSKAQIVFAAINVSAH